MREARVIAASFKGGRFYVRVERADGTTKVMPRASFAWLQANPSFEEIPKGYVVHHLDGDSTNDDPSNLAIMYKFHHVAHHWKQKKAVVNVTIEEGDPGAMYSPSRRPSVRFYRGRWFVRFTDRVDGVSTRRMFSVYDGRRIESKKQAERIAELVWRNSPHFSLDDLLKERPQ